MSQADRIVDILIETQEEVDLLRQYSAALQAAGPVNPDNPGAAKKHRQAGLRYIQDPERRKRMELIYKELGLDYEDK